MQPIRTSMVLADRISMLPDEILCCILSLLTLKEAASTSILSRRWRYLWTSFPRLEFGAENFQEMEANAFVKAVNKVLRVYSGRNLQEFTVRFLEQEIPVREIESYHIDCWIAFAIATGVVKLELDLTYCCFGTLKKYSIPLDLFVGTKGMLPYLKQFDCRSSIVTSPLSIHRQLACLTELVLISVEVTDEVFRIILLRCSSLTHLVLHFSDSLIFAKSTLPHIKLKCLEICGCDNLEKLEISVPNLVSFTCYGLKTTFCIKDAQHLVHVDLRHSILYSDNPYTQQLDTKDFLFGQFSCYISQLERLSLEISVFKEVPVLNGVHLFRNLKQLALIGSCFCSLALCYNLAVFLLKASPFLRLLLLWLPTEYRTSGEELRKISIPRHSNLKELVLCDFQGRRSNIEFVLYIAEHAIALERIGIIRDDESAKQLRKKGIGAEEDEMARYLRESLPPGVQLKFI